MTEIQGSASLRGQVAKLLPIALTTAVNSYRTFIDEEPPADKKKLREHNLALKSCISLIEDLIELADKCLPAESAGVDVSSLVAQAQEEIEGSVNEQ